MSDKPRKEFNAEDLANACLENKDCLKCPGLFICEAFDRVGAACPQYLDLTDPPRFTEAQMALLKALWEIGARFLACDSLDTGAFSERPYFDAETAEWLIDESDNSNVWIFSNSVFGLAEMEVLDLAELFGKEGTK